MTNFMNQTFIDNTTASDQELSNRFIELDPQGYFIIYIDRAQKLICAKHYTNTINDRGLACDPETGEPIPCNTKVERIPMQIFSGKTAKELCVRLFEQTHPCPVSYLDHAAYLGREFQRAEAALRSDTDYIQD
jgi:dihydropteroate synthase